METKHITGNKPKKTPAIAKPSSSVLLISPTNQILLLHRVKTSSSFASAHVFPGGNVSEYHDGKVPEPDHPERHIDNAAYRLAAIRETFEESGILLAKSKETGKLLSMEKSELESGRKLIHSGKTAFPKWLNEHGGIPDTGQTITHVLPEDKLTYARQFSTILSMDYTISSSKALHNTDVSLLLTYSRAHKLQRVQPD